MSVPVTPSPHRIRRTRPLPLFPSLALLVVSGAAAVAVAVAAPGPARAWVTPTVMVAWAFVACTVVMATLLLRQVRRSAVSSDGEIRTAQALSARSAADTAHLVNVALPAVVKKLRDGAGIEETLAATSAFPGPYGPGTSAGPADPQLRRLLEMFASEIAAGELRAATADADCERALRRLTESADDLDRLSAKTLPAAIGGLRQGGSADTVLATLDPPSDPRLRVLMDVLVREFAISERRAAAAQAASAKALSRVQAKAVSMLADLRDMQDRYGEEVFGDLLKLDHNTSQLGLLTDRLALLMGGRGSRAWNKPIAMESILRGAVGRIAAYRRVRLHCSSSAAIAGFAAEGVMHLLAELMDNAANFSPPIDEVHVYVEERTAGIVVTIEDSGLKMADAAMRRAEECVSGRFNDLAALQGTRLGLSVVGRLAAKYRMSVNFRPSSRGGTGVVVLVPPQLLAQQRGTAEDMAPLRGPAPGTAVPQTASPAPAPQLPPPVRADVPPARTEAPTDGFRTATPGGLPVRPPGRTMAAADRDRAHPEAVRGGTGPGRDAGSQFGAFHRSRHSPPQGPPQAPPRGEDGPPAT
ncbi:ATP-binding protein [Streptomyces sp. 150FB]|uniref:sensor histidine kinase n=1 Tax=Streptomyces sp. 150FB TaxID=1576605 RepID=UPI000695E839|nr:ATP-binding protein [Streptomyces sp. 150FB]